MEKVEIFNTGIEVSAGLITVFITIFLLIIAMLFVGRYYHNKKTTKIESNFEMMIQMLFEFISDLTEGFLGKERGEKFVPLAMSLFTIIFVSNTLVTIGLREGATAIIFPLTFGASMFLFWTFYAFKVIGPVSYVKDLFKPIPVMFPIELIGKITMPISMSMRLFGNIFSGYLIMGLLWIAFGAAVDALATHLTIFGGMLIITPIAGVVGSVLTGYFSVFAPFIQALVFTSLTMSNISIAIEE